MKLSFDVFDRKGDDSGVCSLSWFSFVKHFIERNSSILSRCRGFSISYQKSDSVFVSMMPLVLPSDSASAVSDKLISDGTEYLKFDLGYRADGNRYNMIILPCVEPISIEAFDAAYRELCTKYGCVEFKSNPITSTNDELVFREFVFPDSKDVIDFIANEDKLENFEPHFVKQPKGKRNTYNIRTAWSLICDNAAGNWDIIYSDFGEHSLAKAVSSPGKRVDSVFTSSKNVVVCSDVTARSGRFSDWSAPRDNGSCSYSSVEYLCEKYFGGLSERERILELGLVIARVLNIDIATDVIANQSVYDREAYQRESERRLLAERKIQAAERRSALADARAIQKGVNGSEHEILSYFSNRLGMGSFELEDSLKGRASKLPPVFGFNPNMELNNKNGSGSVRVPGMVSAIQRYLPETDSLEHTGDHYTAFEIKNDGSVVKSSIKDPKRKARSFYIDETAIEDLTKPLCSTSGSAIFLSSLSVLKRAGEVHLTEGIENAVVALYLFKKPAISCVDANGLVSVILPSYVKRVTIHVDLDASGTGLKAAMLAKHRFEQEGRTVELKLPDADKFLSFPHIIQHFEAVPALTFERCLDMFNALKKENRNVKILSRLTLPNGTLTDKLICESETAQDLVLLSNSVKEYINLRTNVEKGIVCKSELDTLAEELLTFLQNFVTDMKSEPEYVRINNNNIMRFITKTCSSKAIISLFNEYNDGASVPVSKLIQYKIYKDLSLSCVTVPESYLSSGDVVFTCNKHSMPYANKLLGFDVHLVDGNIISKVKGYDLIDQILENGKTSI